MGIWNSFVDFIESTLISLADFTGSAGLAIILFTIIIKTILLPLTIKSVRSTAAMQEIQPKIKDLQKKYGKDRQKLSQETMKLYAESGINPMAGCLPLILQMPIFFALFFAIKDASNAGEGHFSDSFLWIANLSEPDKMDMLFFSIAPLAILAGVFQFIQMRMMRPANQGKLNDPQQAMMQMMMNFMPLMVVIFGWNFAAGVVLYWAIQSLYSVVQQWFITGWGAMKDWFPWLPELPEHRRLGRRKPSEPKVVAVGEDGDFQPSGLFGFMQRSAKRMEERQTQRVETVNTRKQARNEPPAEELDQPEAETATEDGVVRISAQGGRARRRGQRRRDTVRGSQSGSD